MSRLRQGKQAAKEQFKRSLLRVAIVLIQLFALFGVVFGSYHLVVAGLDSDSTTAVLSGILVVFSLVLFDMIMSVIKKDFQERLRRIEMEFYELDTEPMRE